MRTTKHFIFIKHIVVMLLCALLSAPAMQAQNPQRNGQADQPISQDVLIIIQQQQVRFTAQRAVEQMQLQVFNQTGELIFDSGLVKVNEINWPFQNANGEAVKSGLYAYTLSIKEAGTETARVRRGHFIVDRAQDRDGTDKLWVTSQNDSGVGTELTVARDENGAVAGGTISSERTVGQRSELSTRDGSDRKIEAQDQSQHGNKESVAAVAASTVGQIAKFTSATEVGDSVIAEVNGNIGIGTTETLAKLHVHGTTGIATSGPGAGFFFRNRESNSAHTDYWGWYSQDNVARFWRQGVGDLMSINPSGNVFFGNQTRQMLNLWGTGFGIGVQTANLYYRSGGGFAWHWGGVHNDNTYNSGGGTTLMTLDHLGLSFGARLGQHLRLWSDNATRYFGIGIQSETLYFRSGDGAGDGFAWYKGGFHNS